MGLARITALLVISALVPLTNRPALADDRPIVVLREDDGRDTWRVHYSGLEGKSALEYGKLKRIPITWGIVTGLAAVNSGLTYAELRDYLDTAGGEIASHSCHHAPMASTNDYISELTNSKAAIEQNVPGHICRTFLQPGTWTDDAYIDSFGKLDKPIGQALQATYSQSMAYVSGGWSWRIGTVYYRHGPGATFNIDYQSAPTIQAINGLLDVVAATPGLTLVLTCHGVQESGGTTGYHVQANVLKALMDKMAQLRDGGAIRLMGLHDAYSTVFSDGLNRIADPGFELSGPLKSTCYSPWTISQGADIRTNGGLSDSCYCYFPPNGHLAEEMLLAPGRYMLTWNQKTESSEHVGGGLSCYLQCTQDVGVVYPLLGLAASNSSANTWEEKRALVQIPDRLSRADVFFGSYSGAAFGIDDVSLVPAPLDVSLSPTAVVIQPDPVGYTIQWHSPDDPGAKSITIRSGNRVQPAALVEGNPVSATPIDIQRGDTQSFRYQPVNWGTLNHIYVSVFALKQDGSFSDPGLAFLKVDKTSPQMTQLNVLENEEQTTGFWLANDAESGIYGYEYAVGTSYGSGDIQDWTSTPNTQATIRTTQLSNPTLYLSARAVNPFGVRSNCLSVELAQRVSIGNLVRFADGKVSTVTGIISAVFADAYYVETPDRTRGIKVYGTTTSAIGDTVKVTGTLMTVAGERAITLR